MKSIQSLWNLRFTINWITCLNPTVKRTFLIFRKKKLLGVDWKCLPKIIRPNITKCVNGIVYLTKALLREVYKKKKIVYRFDFNSINPSLFPCFEDRTDQNQNIVTTIFSRPTYFSSSLMFSNADKIVLFFGFVWLWKQIKM